MSMFCFYAFSTRKCRQSERIMFSGSVRRFCFFVRSSGQLLLSRYLMNALNNLIKLTGNIHYSILMTWLDSGEKNSKVKKNGVTNYLVNTLVLTHFLVNRWRSIVWWKLWNGVIYLGLSARKSKIGFSWSLNWTIMIANSCSRVPAPFAIRREIKFNNYQPKLITRVVQCWLLSTDLAVPQYLYLQ